MENITFNRYTDFKNMMDAEIQGAVQGFVNIGYLLKVARDTDILMESGYTSVAEFAKAEYGLTKDVVSRYIRINDRFSKDGYSMELRTEYERYGIGKLQEMIVLPDGINDVLTPELTKGQIAEVRREYQEEQQITDMEVLMEEKDTTQQSLSGTLEKALFECLKVETEVFARVDKAMSVAESMEGRFELLFRALAPKGFENLFGRVPGEGKIMIVIAGRDKEIVTVNMRTSARETFGWPEMLNAVRKIWNKGAGWGDTTGRYESIYGEAFKLPEGNKEPVKKAEVAPVQPKTNVLQRKETPKMQKAEPEPKKPVQKKEPIVQQEKIQDVEENETESRLVSVEPESEHVEISEVREDTADVEPDEQHSEMQVQRQSRKKQLEENIAERVEGIHDSILKLTETIQNKEWSRARLCLSDMKTDVEEIEGIEKQIEDLDDITQMRIEDYEQKEEQ